MAQIKLVGGLIAGVAYGAHCHPGDVLMGTSGQKGGRSETSGTLLSSSRIYTNLVELFSTVQARLDRSAGNLSAHGAKINKQ